MDDKQRWDALPQDTKDTILEKHRQMNVDYDEWWYQVYSDFTEDMKRIGVCVDQIYFSGFWSQGDGACFVGSVDGWKSFLPTLYKDKELKEALEAYIQADSWSVWWTHRGRYYHSNSMSFDSEFYCDNPYDGEGGLREAATKAVNEGYEQIFGKTFDLVEKAMKDHADKLYKSLEEEYDYLTSDECILESLISNDMLGEAIDESDPPEGEDEGPGDEGEQGVGHGNLRVQIDQSTGTGAWQISGSQTCAPA